MNKAPTKAKATKPQRPKKQQKKVVTKKPVKAVAKRTITTSIAAQRSAVTPTKTTTTAAVTPKFTAPTLTAPVSAATTFFQRRKFAANPDSFLQDPKAVEQRVFDVLGRFDKIPKDKLTSNAHFQNDLGLDSLDRVEVVLAIEEEFNTEFTDEQSDKFMGVADVVEFVARRPDVHQRTYKPDDI